MVAAGLRQLQTRAKAAKRRGLQGDGSTVKFREIADNSESEPRAWRRFVRTYPALQYCVPHTSLYPGSIVVNSDDDASGVLG